MSAASDYLQDPDKGLMLWPTQASVGAGQVDLLNFALLGVCALITLIVLGLVLYFSIRYRRGSKARRAPLISEHREHRWELATAGLMLVLFMGLFVWGVKVYVDMYQGPADALTIKVVGKQWMWKLQHPDGTREINTLHVPTGRDIKLDITSQDVIHSFYVPAFRLKRDAVPGAHRSAWFHATEPGEYRLFCAEYCGTDHSRMRGRVVVMTPANYQAWLARDGSARQAGPSINKGKALFSSYGCAGCHRGKTAVRAPSLAGIYGRPVPLANGDTVIADEGYLRDSVLQPQKQVVGGYTPIMPSFAGRISEADLQQIIAYIKSLEPGDWAQEEADR